jgi:hypothetical protein
MQNEKSIKSIRKDLNANSLIALVKNTFTDIPDCRRKNASIPLTDALMSGFAIFSLKEKSLLDFTKNQEKHGDNLRSVYGIESNMTDTHLREMLDPIDPENIRPAFRKVFNRLQRANVLEEFTFLGDHHILSLDGTGYFSSQKVHCAHCMEKTSGNGGKKTYYHQILGAAIVHPDKKAVIPLAPEIIQKQDGNSKNDCERNAAKRFLEKFRKDHPKLKVIVVEDGLSSNAPHIKNLKAHHCRFILGVKPDDHTFLFNQVAMLKTLEKVTELHISEENITHKFSFYNDLPLNESNQDVRINFLEYWEINNKTNTTQHFTYVTDFYITDKNAYFLMRGGRARWKIENETFNTLKNQGYHFEHNYGHGYQHLSNTFASLMMLAFLIDQSLQITCPLFNAAMKKCGTRTNFWSQVKSFFFALAFDGMNKIYEAIYYGTEKPIAKILYPNSS